MKKNIYLLFCGLALMAATTTQAQTKAAAAKTYNGGNYTLTYPGSWDVDESGKMGTKMLLFSPMESEQDDFRECFNVVTEDLQGQDVPLDEYVKVSGQGIEKMMTNGKIISSTKVHQGDRDMYIVNYSGDMGESKLRFEALIWINSGTAYILTFCAKTNTFARYQKQADEVIRSVKVSG